MATDHSMNSNDPLRNPAVDYERSDLSARGILFFLVGLLICGIFIEIVIWGMFRFLRSSEGIFAQGQTNPMVTAKKVPPEKMPGSIMQNTPPDNVASFPEPRLQTRDWVDMNAFLASEQAVLNPAQPFTDANGTVHIPISDAMKLIEQRLQVRPNAPPPVEISGQLDAGHSSVVNEATQPPAQPESGEMNKPK
jgi:hypothetical protein